MLRKSTKPRALRCLSEIQIRKKESCGVKVGWVVDDGFSFFLSSLSGPGGLV
jgi:hypothetical protein